MQESKNYLQISPFVVNNDWKKDCENIDFRNYIVEAP